MHFKCKDKMLHNKLQMNDDKTKAILFARKGLATEHLPKSIKINDTLLTLAYVTRLRSFCNEHLLVCIFGTEVD